MTTALRKTFAGKKVLVTGHTGFKGGWLSLWLGELGAEVTGYAIEPPSEPSLFEAAELAGGLHHIHADVRDYERLAEAVKDTRPDVVFHLAAQSLVRLSYQEPRKTYETNVMGSVNLLEAVRASGAPAAVVMVTSDKCYENQERLWGYREYEPMGGADPYSSSKGCTELMVSAWRRSFFPVEKLGDHGVGLASARAGNVIGGGDWAQDRLLPDCVRAFAAGEAVNIRNPAATRPWQHVIEPVYGYLKLAAALLGEQRAAFADGFNFGPDRDNFRNVGELATEAADHWGDGKVEFGGAGGDEPHEAHFLWLDSTKANQQLRWLPRYDFRTSVEKSIDWYRAYYDGARGTDLVTLTLEQIREYADEQESAAG